MAHLVLGNVIPACIKPKTGESRRVDTQKLVIPSVPLLVVNCQDRFFVFAFDHHGDSACAPDVACVSHIHFHASLHFVHLFAELPGREITLLFFPLDFDVGVGGRPNQLLDHIVNLEAWQKNGPFACADGFRTHEALGFDNEVLVNTLRAEGVPTHCRLSLVNEVEAQRTD